MRMGIMYWIDSTASNKSKVEELYLKCNKNWNLLNETMQWLNHLDFGFFGDFTTDVLFYR